ncbi:MAG: hypothetical protein NTV39_01400 [Candidatus Saccharibacteria bacterium]|nr:hypothetical protein [Candidatus Saccharibacteria bacterium]
MLCFAKRKVRAALAWPSNTLTRIKTNKKALSKFCFRLFVILSMLVLGMVLITPQHFLVRQGDLSYQLALGSRSGGYVQFSLGPLGSMNFRTHPIPINLKMNLVLNDHITTGQDLPNTAKTVGKKFGYDAVNAVAAFLVTRVIIIALIGLAVGISLSNGGEHWFKRKFAIWGVICFVLPALVLIGISYLTFNRTPDISYTGPLAQDLAKAAPYVLKIAKGYQLQENLLNNLIDGAVSLNDQMNNVTDGSQGIPTSGTFILAAGDIHDSTVGMQIASQIINDPKKRFGDISALILAGDITNAGYSWEAHFFDGSLNIGKRPIYFDGGNHENAGAMRTFGQMGYKLLGSQEVNINGVTAIGQSDPTAYDSGLVATPAQLENSSESLAGSWYNYPEPPDVIVVHELAQAKEAIELARADKRNLTVVYGHDHKVGHKTEGTVNLIGSGTSGASGLDGVSRSASYSFQVLCFSSGPNPKLVGVWTLEFDRLDRGGSQHYYPIK